MIESHDYLYKKVLLLLNFQISRSEYYSNALLSSRARVVMRKKLMADLLDERHIEE